MQQTTRARKAKAAIRKSPYFLFAAGNRFTMLNMSMKRWALIASGIVLLVIAAGAFAYRFAEFLLAPSSYKASVTIRFPAGDQKARASRDLIYNRPSFLFSTNILYPVCYSLDLANRWSKFYVPSESSMRLTHESTYVMLGARIGLLNPKSDNESVEFFVCSDEPKEAIEIANAVAQSCKKWFETSVGSTGILIQEATTAERRFLWATSLVKALFLGGPCAAVGSVLVWAGRRQPPPIQLDRPLPDPKFPKC